MDVASRTTAPEGCADAAWGLLPGPAGICRGTTGVWRAGACGSDGCPRRWGSRGASRR